MELVGGELLVGLVEQLAGGEVDDVGGGHGSVELAGFDLDGLDTLGAEVLEDRRRDLAAGRDDLRAIGGDGDGRAGAPEVGDAFGNDVPAELAVGDLDGVYGVEGLEDLLVGAETERAQEDGAQELALAVDADVEGVLLVVLKLHP